ncbi:MAG: DUF3619 family protein [Rubrivivax sp.]|nr:DUF3619 family protein [Rubrivivax sp.]
MKQAPAAHRQQALEARFGLRVAGLLSERPLEHDIQERMRVVRELAVSRARLARQPAAAAYVTRVGSGGAAVLGGTPWWLRLASLAPLMVLALGLVLVEHLDTEERIRAAADIDAVLLADELPPRAYTDPGFAEYLRQATP